MPDVPQQHEQERNNQPTNLGQSQSMCGTESATRRLPAQLMHNRYNKPARNLMLLLLLDTMIPIMIISQRKKNKPYHNTMMIIMTTILLITSLNMARSLCYCRPSQQKISLTMMMTTTMNDDASIIIHIQQQIL